MSQKPVLSVVDYDAWERGYIPPSEHVLIDELAYRGARVLMSHNTEELGFWLVLKGATPPPKGRKIMLEMMKEVLNWEDPEPEEKTTDDKNAPPLEADYSDEVTDEHIEKIKENVGSYERTKE